MLELPLYGSLDEVKAAALVCTGCGRTSTRTRVVFGTGDPRADLMLVGEAPGDADDTSGAPFSGPGGRLLNDLLAELGLDRSRLWLTNVLRCRATEVRDGRKANRPPRAQEIQACSHWMRMELQFVDPRVVVAIGAPAARTLIDPALRLTEQRGEWFDLPFGRRGLATLQPAYLMRVRDRDASEFARLRSLVSGDLVQAARAADLID